MLTPCIVSSLPGIIRQQKGENVLYIAVGIYGFITTNFSPTRAIKNLEKYLRVVDGFVAFFVNLVLLWDLFSHKCFYIRYGYYEYL